MSSLFLTNTSMAADTPSGAETTRHLAGPSAGGAATARNKNSVAGPTAPLPVTDSSTLGTDGGSIAWYSLPLAAVTIAGQITCNLWDRENATANNVAPSVGIWETNAAGAELFQIVNPVTNHAGLEMSALSGTATGVSDVVTITAANVIDRAISAGNRLKIRLYIDDAAGQGGTGSMATGGRGVFWVNGPTGAAGQSEFVFTETLITLNPTIWAGSRIVRQAVKRSYHW